VSTGTDSIGSTSYDFQAQALNVAKKLFFPDYVGDVRDQEAVSMLKVGLFGYMTEIIADMFQDGVTHRDFLYDEFFLNTAKLPRTIYNAAKLANYAVGFANPASMRVTFSLDKAEALKVATDFDGSTKVVVVDRGQPFAVGDFTFMLPRSVVFTFKYVGSTSVPPDRRTAGDYAVTAKYDMSPTDSLPAPASPFLRNYTLEKDGKTYIMAEMTLYQMAKSSVTYNVFSTDVGENLFFNVPFTGGSLAFFDVGYKKGADAAPHTIKKFFNDLASPPGEKEWAYFGFRDDSSLDVYFSSIGDSFRPEFNSQLTVDVYVTLGSKAAFNFDGQILYRFPSGRTSKLEAGIISLGPSAGGSDRLSLLDLKKAVIEYNLTRDSLISEIDVNNYIRKVSSQNAVNGSQFLFLKKRDDIIKRVITCYTMAKGFLSDGTASGGRQYVLPTNTFDIVTSIAELDAVKRVLMPGTQVIYDDSDVNDKHYRFLRSTDSVSDPSRFVYSLPFMMVFRPAPYPRFAYYNTMISDLLDTNFLDVNFGLNGEFVMSGPVQVQRDGSSDSTYDVTFVVHTNVSDADMATVFARALLVKGEDAARKVYGYVDFAKDSVGTQGDWRFHAQLSTKDEFNKSYQIGLTDCVKTLSNGFTLPNAYVDSGMHLEIALMGEDLVDVPHKYGDFALMTDTPVPGVGDGDVEFFDTLVVWKTLGTFDLYKSMSDVMISDTVVNFAGRAVIRSVPGVASQYYSAAKNFDELYRLVKVFTSMLSDIKSRLENNTDLDLKFFNTWGPSTQFDSGTTATSIEIGLKTVGTLAPSFMDDLRLAVAAMVESVNDGAGNGRFSFSNMARVLEEKFDSISYIELRKIDGDPTRQTIKSLAADLSTMTVEQLIRFVPEYLSVANKPASFASDPRKFVPDITITQL
jgi:hypothetical protein